MPTLCTLITVLGILLSNNIALRWNHLFAIKNKKVFISELVNGQIPGILHGHQVTFGKKHQKQGSTVYQSSESLLQLSNWLAILVSSLLLLLFFFQDNKKCKKMKIVLREKARKKYQKMMEALHPMIQTILEWITFAQSPQVKHQWWYDKKQSSSWIAEVYGGMQFYINRLVTMMVLLSESPQQAQQAGIPWCLRRRQTLLKSY